MMTGNETYRRQIQRVQAVLFDMDGTLVDTDDVVVAALAKRLRPLLGKRAASFARWLVMQIETPGNAFITLLDALHVDELWRSVTAGGQSPQTHTFQLIPGVEEMILRVASKYQVGIVTTRGREEIDAFLQQYPAFGSVVAVTMGREDTRRLKPHPAPVRAAAAKLSLLPEQCLMVGDTTVDVRSGRKAGAWTVGVLCGFGQERELWRCGAHAVLASTAELADFLRIN